MPLISLIPNLKNEIFLISKKFFQAADIGGSMILHTFGAYFGLACATALTRKDNRQNPNNETSSTSDVFSMIGECVRATHGTLVCPFPNASISFTFNRGRETFQNLTNTTVHKAAASHCRM